MTPHRTGPGRIGALRDTIIGIVGFGPGGLTAALALTRIGHPVEVLERAPDIRPVGAGLTLQVNAMHMLAALDLADAVQTSDIPVTDGFIARPDGTPLAGMGMDAGWEGPGVAIHRGDLSRILADHLPEGTMQCGAAVAAAHADGRVEIASGETRTYDAVVGADGIHSVVRTSVFGQQPLRYASAACWRGVAAHDAGTAMVERIGRGLRFGSVPLRPGRTYWFATANGPAGGRDGADPTAEMLDRSSTFEPLCHDLIRSAPDILRHDLIDLTPQPTWTRGRVTLLGDAAHAMTPNLGQGAGQSIQDALVLASAIDRHGLPDGLTAYEAACKPRAQSFVRRSWWMGQALQVANPVLCGVRDLALAWTPDWVMRQCLAEVYGVEVPALSATDWTHDHNPRTQFGGTAPPKGRSIVFRQQPTDWSALHAEGPADRLVVTSGVATHIRVTGSVAGWRDCCCHPASTGCGSSACPSRPTTPSPSRRGGGCPGACCCTTISASTRPGVPAVAATCAPSRPCCRESGPSWHCAG